MVAKRPQLFNFCRCEAVVLQAVGDGAMMQPPGVRLAAG